MIKKIGILLLIILITPIIAGLYGVIHDQISFTISNEYYTRFKFDQFGVGAAETYRLGASYVGWMATWWMGVPLGIILGLIGLIHFDWKLMFKAYYKSLPLIIATALLTGFCGLIYGRLFLIDKDLAWFIPDNLIDRKHFIMVGSMHNFSYVGGLTGLITGIIYHFKHSAVTQRNSWESWIKFMLEATEKTSILTNTRINEILSQMDSTLEYAKKKIKWYNKEINEAIFSQLYIKPSLIGEILGKTSRTTITKYMNELVDYKILTPRKDGVEVFYINEDLIRILEGQ